MLIQRMNKDLHDRDDFDCGNPELNNYLKNIARQHDDLCMSRVFVLTEFEGSEKIIGYYSVSLCNIHLDEFPVSLKKKYPRYIKTISSALVGRLAVKKGYQGKNFGTALLIDAIKKISCSPLAVPFVIVDAKDESVKKFYSRFGFEEISTGSMRMVLSTKNLKEFFV